LRCHRNTASGLASSWSRRNWICRSGYYARLALATGSLRARHLYAQEVLDAAELLDYEHEAVLPIRAMAEEALGRHAAAAELYERGAKDSPDALVQAGLAWVSAGQPQRAAPLLERAVEHLEHTYVLTAADHDVEYLGAQLTRVAGALAFIECAAGNWSSGLAHADRAKSRRLRHQQLLRRSPEAADLLRLEEMAFAAARGARWTYRGVDCATFAREELPYRTEYWLDPAVGLRLAVRETMEAAALPSSPTHLDLASALMTDEAVLMITFSPQGTIVALVGDGDREEPSGCLLDTAWPLSRWTALNGAEALLARLDEIIGPMLTETLTRRPVRRLWVVPHLWTHAVPFQALPCLRAMDVVQLPSAASLLEFTARPSAVTGRAVVLGNPTADLALAELECQLIGDLLAGEGLATEVRPGDKAVRSAVSGCGLLHFAGHGRSDRIDPKRSALMLHHAGATAQLAEGHDPLEVMASEVSLWWRINDKTRESAVAPVGTLRETRRDDVVERTFEHTRRQSVMIRRRGDRAMAADLWTAGEIALSDDLAQCRLAVLTACESADAVHATDLVDESSGLPAALALCGVCTVVAPLWPIADDAGLLFARRFYQILFSSIMDGRADVATDVQLAQEWLQTLTRRNALDELRAMHAASTDARIRDRLAKAMVRLTTAVFPYQKLTDRAAFVVLGAGQVTLSQGAPK
jgi:tetratricopeptide (TPR) repeat protein